MVGAITAVLGCVVISPVYPYCIGTQISVVIGALAVMRLIGFDQLWKAVVLGASDSREMLQAPACGKFEAELSGDAGLSMKEAQRR